MNGHSRSDWTDGLEKTLLAAISDATEKASLQSLALLAASAGCIRDDEQVSDAYAAAVAKKAILFGKDTVTDPIIRTAVFTLAGGVSAYAAKKMGLDVKKFHGLKTLAEAREHNAIVTALCEATQPTTVCALARLIERTAINKAGLDNVYTALVGATRRLQIKDEGVIDAVVRAAVSLMPNKLEDVAAKFNKDATDLRVIVTQLRETVSTEYGELALARVA